MYIISTFEQTINLEIVLTSLMMKGIPKEDILAVPMDKKNEDRMLFDRTHSSDSLSMLDLPIILGAIFSLFGVIYGFKLSWGPVLWALIGTGFGVGIGILIKLYTTRKRNEKQRNETAEVVVFISCKVSQMQMVQDALWAYSALGVGKLSLGDDT